MLVITANHAPVLRDLKRVKRAQGRATIGALNDTNRSVRSNAIRTVAREEGIKVKALRRGAVIPRRRRASTRRPDKAGGFVNVVVPLIDTLRGVRAARAAQGENLFLAQMKSGHRGLFFRKITARKKLRRESPREWTELPIEEKRIVFTRQVNHAIMVRARTHGRETFRKRFQAKMRRAIRAR